MLFTRMDRATDLISSKEKGDRKWTWLGDGEGPRACERVPEWLQTGPGVSRPRPKKSEPSRLRCLGQKHDGPSQPSRVDGDGARLPGLPCQEQIASMCSALLLAPIFSAREASRLARGLFHDPPHCLASLRFLPDTQATRARQSEVRVSKIAELISVTPTDSVGSDFLNQPDPTDYRRFCKKEISKILSRVRFFPLRGFVDV
jgi:hypothetical protein